MTRHIKRSFWDRDAWQGDMPAGLRPLILHTMLISMVAILAQEWLLLLALPVVISGMWWIMLFSSRKRRKQR
jgi:hypothetical protein